MTVINRYALAVGFAVAGTLLWAESPALRQSEIEFFESRIRPVLIEQCYACHNSSETTEGGLSLDHNRALLAGGGRGKVIVPGNPDASMLIAVLKHEIDGLEMPEDGPKLENEVIRDFERWIAMGAPDPRTTVPTADEVTLQTSWEWTLLRRKQWWSFQPIEDSGPPGNKGHAIDRFVQAKLAEVGLPEAPRADPPTLIRRLFLTLIGLPPTPSEAQYWHDRLSEDEEAIEQLIDHLLASDHFGERWARHWMDWIRYAESHGSEGDPAIAGAWLYRDYLIRAINADVPYDQLVREHIAGDLLDQPRINESLGINESMIGPTHWRMVFHGFAPTDALDEKVRFIDDQINAFSKAFLGLTVSCARCHDHKFDAISQQDYYALFGIFASCRPGRNVIDLPDRLNRHREAVTKLKPKIRAAIASDWLESLPSLQATLLQRAIDVQEEKKIDSVLDPLVRLRNLDADGQFDAAWRELVQQVEATIEPQPLARWDLSRPDDYASWYRQGNGLPTRPSKPGEFAIADFGPTALQGIYPAGVYSHTVSAKHAARLTSADFRVAEESDLWLRVIGDGGASVRYVIEDYPRRGTVYPVSNPKPEWTWQRFDLAYWKGDSAHIELTAGKDAPLLVGNKDRSWFGVTEVRLTRKGQPAPQAIPEYLSALADAAKEPPQSLDDVAKIYISAIGDAVRAWKSDTATNAQAQLLDGCLHVGLISNELQSLATAAPLIQKYRQLESEIVAPTRVPGLDETVGRTQPLFVRGNHKQTGEVVPRRFLEAIDASPYDSRDSGRRQLAEDLLREDNPLTRRVIVNRLWHHLFGRGIVETPDNFGRLGSKPTHGTLLDWLANRFSRDGWSLKKLIRLIVTSRTWQQSSRPSAEAKRIDPDNRYLSHASIRRLEAEAIRDSLLAVSGQLDRSLYGQPVGGNSNRRSVYVEVIRNRLDPLLRAFDFPEPFSATGRRDVTNVPAQSLALMNDPQVAKYAAALASSILGEHADASDDERLTRMFLTLFAREASSGELATAKDYLASTAQVLARQRRQRSALQSEIDDMRSQISAILDPMIKELTKQAKANASQQKLPQPIARWEFDQDLKDSIGSHHGNASGNARVADDALVLQSGAFVTTLPLKRNIKEKTLEVWLMLSNLEQRGGGAVTIQTANGVLFDSIVFAEAEPRRWMAGSNNFQRTQSFAGPQETEATDRVVHVAIAYHADGRIVGYRDGKRYGKPYQSNGPIEFNKGDAIVSFGLRHLPAGGNRLLSGQIERAQIYDQALSDEEIAASFAGSDFVVSPSQLLAALSQDERNQVVSMQNQLGVLQSRLHSMGKASGNSAEQDAWTDLVQGMLTLQEFIYVR